VGVVVEEEVVVQHLAARLQLLLRAVEVEPHVQALQELSHPAHQSGNWESGVSPCSTDQLRRLGGMIHVGEARKERGGEFF
jgi:hypothetical protein